MYHYLVAGIISLTKQIKKWSLALGLSESESEDFSQDCAERWLDGRRSKCTPFKWLLIDYRRANNRHKYVPIAEFDFPAAPTEERTPILDGYLLGLNKPERICVVLKYKWGLTSREIAHAFGVDEARISQIFKKLGQLERGNA